MHPVTRRITGLFVIGAFALVAVVLLWADRGRQLGGEGIDFVVRSVRFFERETGLDVGDRSDVPGTADQIGHVALWAIGTVVVGAALIRRRTLVQIAVAMSLISLGAEMLQPFVSTHRTFEPNDALANLIGVLLGSAMLAATLTVMRGTAVVRNRTSRGSSVAP